MAQTKIEISTIDAVRKLRTLRDVTKNLAEHIRSLDRAIKALNPKFKTMGTELDKVNKSFTVLNASARKVAMGNIAQADSARRASAAAKVFARSLERAALANTHAAAASSRMGTAAQKQGQSVRRASKDIDKAGTGFRNFGSAAIFALGPLSGLGARITAFGAVVQRSNLAIAAFAVATAAMALAFTKVITGAIRANLEFTRMRNTLKAVSKDNVTAGRTFIRLSEVSTRLGVDIRKVGLGFAQFMAAARGTTLQGKEAERAFNGILTAGTALGLSSVEIAGALRAVQQMMSKGTVQAEELRGQLGERLPGAFQLAATAMGVTTRELGKMLERGDVLASDLIPKLVDLLENKFTNAANLASTSLQAAFGRFQSEFALLFDEIDRRFKLSTKLAWLLNTASANARGQRLASQPTLGNLQSQYKAAWDERERLRARRIALQSPATKGFAALLTTPETEKRRAETLPLVVARMTELTGTLDEIWKTGNRLSFSIEQLRGQVNEVPFVPPPYGGYPMKHAPLNKEFKLSSRHQSRLSRAENAADRLQPGALATSAGFLQRGKTSAIGRGGSERIGKVLGRTTKLGRVDADDIDDLARAYERTRKMATGYLYALTALSQTPAEKVAMKYKIALQELAVPLKAAGVGQEALNDILAPAVENLKKLEAAEQALAELKRTKVLTTLEEEIDVMKLLNQGLLDEAEYLKTTQQLQAQRIVLHDHELVKLKALLLERRKQREELKVQQQTHRELETVVSNSMRGIEDAIISAFQGGESAMESFRNFAAAIINDVMRMFIRLAITNPLERALVGPGGVFGIGGAGGGGGTPTPPPGGSPFNFASPRQHGGPFRAGQALRVGEAGEETVVFGRSGTVIPNGGGGVIINVNNNAPNTHAEAKRSKTAGGGERIDVMVNEAVARNIRQGGAVAQSIATTFGASPTTIGR